MHYYDVLSFPKCFLPVRGLRALWHLYLTRLYRLHGFDSCSDLMTLAALRTGLVFIQMTLHAHLSSAFFLTGPRFCEHEEVWGWEEDGRSEAPSPLGWGLLLSAKLL